jgi:hypothetical protein
LWTGHFLCRKKIRRDFRPTFFLVTEVALKITPTLHYTVRVPLCLTMPRKWQAMIAHGTIRIQDHVTMKMVLLRPKATIINMKQPVVIFFDDSVFVIDSRYARLLENLSAPPTAYLFTILA